MRDHADAPLGSAAVDGGFIDVLVSGVDVRLTLRRDAREDVVVFLGPDAAINPRDLLDQALDA